MKRKCGTPEYCAPEVLTGAYKMSCDMWSLGVLVYIMISGYMPFRGKNVQETLERVKKGKLDFDIPIWKDRTTLSKDFISRLIEKNV